MAKLSPKNQVHYDNALPKLQSADWAEVQAGIEQIAALNIPILLRHLASGISCQWQLKRKARCWVEVTVDAAHRKDAALWIAVASGKLDAVVSLDLRGYTRVPPLQRLVALRQLYLDPGTTDLSILAQLPNLTWLRGDLTALTSLDGIDAAPGLQHLSLRGCKKITDFTPLARLTSLTYLRLWETQIEDLSPLSGLVELTYLDLNSTPIRDIAPLHRLSKLTTLHIHCPNLPDQSMSGPWGGAALATLLARFAPAV